MRRRNQTLTISAALLAAVGGVWLVVVVPSTLGRVEWHRVEPAWMLRRTLASTDQGTAVAAANELLRRLQGNSLTDGQAVAAVESALARQADTNARWDPSFGDLVEAARARGLVEDALWSRYARHAPQLAFEVRPVLRQGESLPYAVVLQPARIGRGQFRSSTDDTLSFSHRLVGTRVNGGEIKQVEDRFLRLHGRSSLSLDRRWLGEDRRVELPDVPVGDVTVTLVFEVRAARARM